MLGLPKHRCLTEPISVSLEGLVPGNNFYCHLETTLDLSFVREWAQELYAERGRHSIAPVVFFKPQLLMFFEGIRSDRQPRRHLDRLMALPGGSLQIIGMPHRQSARALPVHAS